MNDYVIRGILRKNLVDAYHSSLGGSLHGDLGVWVDLEAGIEDSIGDLVAELVWVALTDGLGGEVEMSLLEILHL